MTPSTSKARKAVGLCEWVLSLPFALLVIGPGVMFLIGNVIRIAFPEFTDVKACIIAASLQLAIGLGIALLVMRKKITKPLFVAAALAAAISNTTCSAFACVLTYKEYQRTAPYRKLIGPLGGPDLLMPKPGADVAKVEIGMLRGHRTEEDTPPPLLACTNSAAIRGLLAALQQGRKVEDHKCSSEGVIFLHSGTNTLEKVEFLAGHAYRYYEYRHAHGIYRLLKKDFLAAISGLGFDIQSLSSPSPEIPNAPKR